MRRCLVMCFALCLAACTNGTTIFPIDESGQSQLAENVVVTRLDASNIRQFSNPDRAPVAASLDTSRHWEYRIGPGDVLVVTVFGQPDLNVPAGSQRSAVDPGFAVQADGTFFYPFIGSVLANNRTISDVRTELSTRLAEYIPNPQVDIRVGAFNSQSVLVGGEVKSANTQALTTVPLTLLGAINAAGGISEDGDLTRVALQRGDHVTRIDVTGFLERGYRQNNPILRNGDTVIVPKLRALEAFLLGEIADPATIDLSNDRISLTQALTLQGGLRDGRADARGVFVFRAGLDDQMNVFQLDASSPTGLLLGTRFSLEPGDVVYVTSTALQRWNDTITRILPTVQAVSISESLR